MRRLEGITPAEAATSERQTVRIYPMGPIGVVHTNRSKKDFQQRNGVASITPHTGADAKNVLTYVHATQDGVGEGDAHQRCWGACLLDVYPKRQTHRTLPRW